MDSAPEFSLSDAQNGDHFIIDDLFDFPNDGCDGGVEVAVPGDSAASAAELVHFHRPVDVGGHFSSEFCVPYDDLAELEWLSNFVDESFSGEALPNSQHTQGIEARNEHSGPEANSPIIRPEISVPAKARSKRSRAAPHNWASRLPVMVSPAASSSSDSGTSAAGEGRRCLHCASDKTPQWRTGPMGPKTLCNACGVRYKSGRLVPEYRPAASPTFVLTKHSNSHRKVVELRRQKEMFRAQQQQQFLHHHNQNVMFDASSNGEDYLIHQHVGPDFRQLI